MSSQFGRARKIVIKSPRNGLSPGITRDVIEPDFLNRPKREADLSLGQLKLDVFRGCNNIEDWITTYVSELIIVGGVPKKLAYVECDYVE